MTLDQLYRNIENRLGLSCEQADELKKLFPDPKNGSIDSDWDGNDICEAFNREKRHNRSQINEWLREYVMATDKPIKQVDEMELSEG